MESLVEYLLSAADQAPFPASYSTEARYLKFRETDQAKPYAKFFRTTTRPLQPHVVEALVAGMAPTEYGYGVDVVADRITRPGYEPLETGWTRLDSGVYMVSVLTPMPNVTAAMWDWWFGWHGRETARYKLWFPDAHQFSALGEDRSGDGTLTDRQRYVGNVSYVDEYVGGQLLRLAIRFLDPSRVGIVEAPGTTHICARVGLSTYPVAIGWLIHQVRPTVDGAEMRSRFFLNDTKLLALPARALPPGGATRILTSAAGRALGAATLRSRLASRLMPSTLGPDMVFHCASEMNHLASFLPDLHAEFHDQP